MFAVAELLAKVGSLDMPPIEAYDFVEPVPQSLNDRVIVADVTRCKRAE